jgi:uroporphyrinogen-III synthase
VVAYQTAAGNPDPGAAEAAARSDVIAFTSSSTVTRTLDLLGTAGVPPLVVTIGPVTSATAGDAGLEVAAEASPHTITGVVDAVVDAVARQRAGNPTPDRGDGGRAVGPGGDQ